MTYPVYAIYGNKEGSHSLLEWDPANGELPDKLAGLTDRPPGVLASGEKWWPSVGCGCIDKKWFALWWTIPDIQAKRSGMVSSRVALWPIDLAIELSDLSPFLLELAGNRIEEPPTSFLKNIFQALVNNDAPKPVIVSCLKYWPGIIASLWRSFTPEIRRLLFARVVLNIPQKGSESLQSLVVCVPESKLAQWMVHEKIITLDSPVDLESNSQVAKWLAGEHDAIMEEVAEVFINEITSFEKLRKLGRFSEVLTKFRQNHDIESAIEVLRKLEPIAPSNISATRFKLEAISALQSQQEFDYNHLILLRNINLDFLPPTVDLTGMVKRVIIGKYKKWAGAKLCDLAISLKKGKAYPWWQTAVGDGIQAVFPDLDCATIKKLLTNCVDNDELLQLLPNLPSIEEILIRVTEHVDKNTAKLLISHSKNNGWSQLHAYLTGKIYGFRKALDLQIEAFGIGDDNIKKLFSSLPDEEAVDYAIASPRFATYAVKRIANNSNLLDRLDTNNSVWRQLWLSSIEEGGEKWPPNSNKKELILSLLNLLSDQIKTTGCCDDIRALVHLLLPDAINHFSAYDDLIYILELSCTLEINVDEVLIERFILSLNCCTTKKSKPSSSALNKINSYCKASTLESLSAKGLVMLLEWECRLSEQKIIRLCKQLSVSDIMEVAIRLGEAIKNRRLKEVADEIYKRAKDEPAYKIVLDKCEGMISFFKKGLWSHGWSNDYMTQCVAELGAQICPNSLQAVWTAAGGSAGSMPVLSGSIRDQWQNAAVSAAHSALPHGLKFLVDALLFRVPHNEELKHIKELL